MRLKPENLIASCKTMARETNNKYEIIPTKSEYGHWRLDIKNNETGETQLLIGGLLLREAYETLRGIYAILRFIGYDEEGFIEKTYGKEASEFVTHLLDD